MRRKTLLVPTIAVALMGGAWWWTRGPVDPVYQGERLSEWLYQSVPYNEDRPPTRKLTADDLKAMGPDAVTWLIHALEHGHLTHAVEHFPPPLPPSFDRLRDLGRKYFHLRLDDYYDERMAAADALFLLGPDAAPAIPALLRATDNAWDNQSSSAWWTLYHIGPAAWPAIKDALAHGPRLTRVTIAGGLPNRLSDPEWTITDAEHAEIRDLLLAACQDSDADVRLAAANSVGEISEARQFDPAMQPAISTLIAFLSDSDSHRWIRAAEALSHFRTEARAAIPRLIELLAEPNPKVSSTMAVAIHRIDSTDKRVVPRLRQMLDDTYADNRENAANFLLELGELPAKR